MPTTEVILIENIPGLGAEADVVRVKAGYARNFLVPRSKAYEVTPTAMKKLNMLRAKRAEREARELNEAQDLSRKLNKLKLVFVLETGGTGKAFGSVTAKDIAEKVKTELHGIEIERHRIVLDRAIKETGAHEVPVKLHHDITATLHLTVKAAAEAEASEEEADAPATEKTGFKGKAKARHTAK